MGSALTQKGERNFERVCIFRTFNKSPQKTMLPWYWLQKRCRRSAVPDMNVILLRPLQGKKSVFLPEFEVCKRWTILYSFNKSTSMAPLSAEKLVESHPKELFHSYVAWQVEYANEFLIALKQCCVKLERDLYEGPLAKRRRYCVPAKKVGHSSTCHRSPTSSAPAASRTCSPIAPTNIGAAVGTVAPSSSSALYPPPVSKPSVQPAAVSQPSVQPTNVLTDISQKHHHHQIQPAAAAASGAPTVKPHHHHASQTADSKSKRDREKRTLPDWCRPERLAGDLRVQANIDPESIFGRFDPSNVDLTAVFFGTESVKRIAARPRREASKDWTHDRFTVTDELLYKEQVSKANHASSDAPI